MDGLKQSVAAAFKECRSGLSSDRVIADPDLNQQFILCCRKLGRDEPEKQLNATLMNLRKQGLLRGLRSKRTTFTDTDDYRFASEIAVRHLERSRGVTLDQILCDPGLAIEFDETAARLAPHYSSLKYRWAALGLRKTHQLSPEILSRVIRPESVTLFDVPSMDVTDVPSNQGLYVFFDSRQCLYVGEATNLQNRIRKHLDHSDNKGLARWIWECGTESLKLETQTLPTNTKTAVRKAFELELIRSRNPVFNVKR
jgi:predicted GIY-YIG superfamily endonuclease